MNILISAHLQISLFFNIMKDIYQIVLSVTSSGQYGSTLLIYTLLKIIIIKLSINSCGIVEAEMSGVKNSGTAVIRWLLTHWNMSGYIPPGWPPTRWTHLPLLASVISGARDPDLWCGPWITLWGCLSLLIDCRGSLGQLDSGCESCS